MSSLIIFHLFLKKLNTFNRLVFSDKGVGNLENNYTYKYF